MCGEEAAARNKNIFVASFCTRSALGLSRGRRGENGVCQQYHSATKHDTVHLNSWVVPLPVCIKAHKCIIKKIDLHENEGGEGVRL